MYEYAGDATKLSDLLRGLFVFKDFGSMYQYELFLLTLEEAFCTEYSLVATK